MAFAYYNLCELIVFIFIWSFSDRFACIWLLVKAFTTFKDLRIRENAWQLANLPCQYISTFRQAKLYKMAQAFALAWNYGTARIMSSYFWDQDINQDGKDRNDWVGPPNVDGVNKWSCYPSESDLRWGWICEHRWRQIVNMVRFRNVVEGTEVGNWYDNGKNQIAFSRGNKGFIAINNDDQRMVATVQTRMPAGLYCGVISGGKLENGSCSDRTIRVDADGKISVDIAVDVEDPMIAIHI